MPDPCDACGVEVAEADLAYKAVIPAACCGRGRLCGACRQPGRHECDAPPALAASRTFVLPNGLAVTVAQALGNETHVYFTHVTPETAAVRLDFQVKRLAAEDGGDDGVEFYRTDPDTGESIYEAGARMASVTVPEDCGWKLQKGSGGRYSGQVVCLKNPPADWAPEVEPVYNQEVP